MSEKTPRYMIVFPIVVRKGAHFAFCSKGFYAVGLQGFSDSDGRFLSISMQCCSSVHDSVWVCLWYDWMTCTRLHISRRVSASWSSLVVCHPSSISSWMLRTPVLTRFERIVLLVGILRHRSSALGGVRNCRLTRMLSTTTCPCTARCMILFYCRSVMFKYVGCPVSALIFWIFFLAEIVNMCVWNISSDLMLNIENTSMV